MKYIKLSNYAKLTGIHYRTAEKHFHAGLIKGYKSPTGRIFVINPEQLDLLPTSKKAILYARVSSSTNKSSLDGQIERMRLYAAAKGYEVVGEYKEIASGMNDSRKLLNSIFQRNDFSILISEQKDRLTRFGFQYIESLLKRSGVAVEIINQTENKDKEIMEDFISIITSFCGKIYGRNRKAKTKEIIDKINEN